MKILSWYIGKTYLKYWVLCLMALLLLVVISRLFGSIDTVFTSSERLRAFLDETLQTLPTFLDVALPITVLLSTVFTFNSLGPIFVLLIFIAALDYYNQNYLFRLVSAPEALHARISFTHQWRAADGRIIYLERILPNSRRLDRVRIFHWAGSPFRLFELERVQRITRPDGQRWIFAEVLRRREDGDGWRLERQEMQERAAEEFPDVFQQDVLDAHHLPFLDLYTKIRQLESPPARVVLYELEWYQKTAAMFAPFVLVWFGAPLSQAYFRRGRASGDVIIGILGGLLFLIATEILYTLGKGGFLHPVLATWSVNLVYISLGGLLMRRIR
jgi:lipopolysaccharide export LptBFGC system permease protein LptF